MMLTRLGVKVGALDLFVPAMLRPGPLTLWHELAGLDSRKVAQAMPPVLAAQTGSPPPGYRSLGRQWLRLDMAEKLLREAHGHRVAAGRRALVLDPARPISMGLATASYSQLLRLAGFQPIIPRPLPEGGFGPPHPLSWRWRPPRRRQDVPAPAAPPPDNAFSVLAELVR